MKTPDITPVQIVALLQAVLAVGAAFGLDLSEAQQNSLLDLATIVTACLVGGDALIRNGRARMVAQAEVVEESDETDI